MFAYAGACCVTCAWANPAQEAKLFEDLFGGLRSAALATAGEEDDLRVALTMVEAARQSTQLPGFLEAACTGAYQLASPHESGEAVATQAMRLRAKYVPGKVAESLGRVLRMEERRFGRLQAQAPARRQAARDLVTHQLQLAEVHVGDNRLAEAAELFRKAATLAAAEGDDRAAAVADQAALAERRAAAVLKYDRLVERLVANPKDRVSLDAALRLAVVEMDDPVRAAALKAYADSKTRSTLEHAIKPLETLAPEELLELGQWYRDWAQKTPPAGRAPILQRAQRCFKEAVRRTTGTDIERRRAALFLERNTEDLEKLGTPGAPPSPPPSPAPSP